MKFDIRRSETLSRTTSKDMAAKAAPVTSVPVSAITGTPSVFTTGKQVGPLPQLQLILFLAALGV